MSGREAVKEKAVEEVKEQRMPPPEITTWAAVT
jgi:hypothetical protein